MPEIEKLREIKGLESIPDISLYLFSATVLAVILFLGALGYMGGRYYLKKRREDIRAKVLKRLLHIDFSDSKKAAYQITRYGRYLADEERSQKLFAQLLPKLEKYKFTPNPPPFYKEDLKYYDLFTESVDE